MFKRVGHVANRLGLADLCALKLTVNACRSGGCESDGRASASLRGDYDRDYDYYQSMPGRASASLRGDYDVSGQRIFSADGRASANLRGDYDSPGKSPERRRVGHQRI